jgi:DNA repair protein RadC
VTRRRPATPFRRSSSGELDDASFFRFGRERPQEAGVFPSIELLAEECTDDAAMLARLVGLAVPRLSAPDSVARRLLAEHGTLEGVFAAAGRAGEAWKPWPDALRVMLLVVHETRRRMQEAALRARRLLASGPQLHAYLHTILAHERVEQIRVLYVDSEQYLLEDVLMGQGTVDHAPVYPREVVRRGLELDAAGLILVHNHPSGNPAPSDSDIIMTERVIAAAAVFDMIVLDHVIVGGGRIFSLKAEGLL